MHSYRCNSVIFVSFALFFIFYNSISSTMSLKCHDNSWWGQWSSHRFSCFSWLFGSFRLTKYRVCLWGTLLGYKYPWFWEGKTLLSWTLVVLLVLLNLCSLGFTLESSCLSRVTRLSLAVCRRHVVFLDLDVDMLHYYLQGVFSFMKSQRGPSETKEHCQRIRTSSFTINVYN